MPRLFITTTGTFTIPADFGFLVSIECIGGGASAPNANSGYNGGYGGGGGGAYAAITSLPALAANAVYNVQVAAADSGGDTWFMNAATVLAKGGSQPSQATGGQGGQASQCIGATKYSGGNGGNGPVGAGQGGGGGGAAGPNGAGANGGDGNATTNTGGQGGTGDAGFGGAGGAGATATVASSAGANGTEWGTYGSGGGGGGRAGTANSPAAAGGSYGGGGGGSGATVGYGGVGGAGLIVFTYLPPRPVYVFSSGTLLTSDGKEFAILQDVHLVPMKSRRRTLYECPQVSRFPITVGFFGGGAAMVATYAGINHDALQLAISSTKSGTNPIVETVNQAVSLMTFTAVLTTQDTTGKQQMWTLKKVCIPDFEMPAEVGNFTMPKLTMIAYPDASGNIGTVAMPW